MGKKCFDSYIWPSTSRKKKKKIIKHEKVIPEFVEYLIRYALYYTELVTNGRLINIFRRYYAVRFFEKWSMAEVKENFGLLNIIN